MFRSLLIAAAVLFAASPAFAGIKVVASFSIIGDMAHEVGGDRITLTTLVGANGDAHVYEPTPSDARAVTEADLVLVNGLNFDPWMERLTRTARFKGRVVTLSQGVRTVAAVDTHRHGREAEADPHAWQSLANGQVYAANLASALANADPANAPYYRSRGDAYGRTLASLHDKVRGTLAAIPKEDRRVITSHAAFAYFAAAYDVDFRAPLGISTEAQASAGDVSRLITQIRRDKIRAVFIENITDPRLLDRLAKESGVAIGGTLYSDALSPLPDPAGTYVKMFEANLATITAALKR